jgi:hypothetical protein
MATNSGTVIDYLAAACSLPIATDPTDCYDSLKNFQLQQSAEAASAVVPGYEFGQLGRYTSPMMF